MESGNGSAWSKGVLMPVSTTSDAFQSNIVALLKSAYLYEESKQSFRYKSAVLIKNPELEKKYNAFRTKRRQLGYSEEDLEESYGFLLFEDVNKANALGDTGVLTGNSTCTTLGDPSNGVYISMYSDCLDQNRWYHGKSGYIAIIRLTKGKVKKVLENYTQNFTAPTEGFDCHVSEQLPSVSAKTSSFLAFERTQYYMYELLDHGSNETVQSPSAACPFAIVSFSYTDTKATLVASQEKSVVKKLDWFYFPWRGRLQIGSRVWDVGLRSTAGALMASKLPPVVKVDRAIAMLDLKQLLPGTVFEICFSGEAFMDGLHCSLCEFVSSEADQASSLSQLLREIKEKDVALTIPLNDGGFLILLHSSHFLTYDDSGSSVSEVLQGMFVFPDSRVIHPDTKFGQRKPAMSSEILRVLPVLSYAEAEVEKTPTDPSGELCEVFVQHMQNYAALINPGLVSSPSRDLSIFPDEYDVPDAHKHLYSSPEWTNRAWQNLTSYLSKPGSFQLPVSKATEILAAGQVEQMEDLDDDVYFCLSSPEEVRANPVGTASEDQLTDPDSSLNVETSVDSCISSEAQVVPQNVAPEDLQLGDDTKDTEKSDLALPIKPDDIGTKNLLAPSTSDDLPAELIVSITSAERTVTDGSLSVVSSDSATKHNDFQLSGFSTTKLQSSSVNSLDDETVKKKDFECPLLTNLTKTKRRKPHMGHFTVRKHVSKACVETPSSQPLKILLEVDNVQWQKEEQDQESSGDPQLINPSNIDLRKARRRKRIFGKLSSKKVRTATVGPTVAEETKSDLGQESFESTILRELEACPLRKKMERWDLKPVISECGRILVPHGSVEIVDRIKALKDKGQVGKDETVSEKMLDDESVVDHDNVKMELESSIAPEATVDETEVTTHKSEGNLPQSVDVSHSNPNHSILRQLYDGSGSSTLKPENSEHASKTEVTGSPSIKTIQEKHVDTLSPEKRASKGEVLLNKLKSVLLRGKRKTVSILAEEITDTAQDTEPCLKKGKVDSHSGMLESHDINATVPDSSLGVKGVSVDPCFAYALGLTPKETQNKVHIPEDQDTQQWKGSSETQEQTILDKLKPQIIQRPLSIFPRRGRIKTLKKHQGISTECVKKKWWLHFQTPACFDSEKLKHKESIRDSSVRKTEKSNTDCSPTDALSLLADLALSVSNGQVPPQPDPAVEREPETSLKKCDLAKDVASDEQESVLHTLLRQPVPKPSQPLESPSSNHLVVEKELVGLISKEHAYSLPPSSCLLSDLSGTPFQVSPLSGSTRLLHHHQTMHGDGIKTLHSSVNQEDRGEHNHSAPEHLKKHMVQRRKFRHSRTIVNNDGSVQVTKQWKENYDFNLDSKFTTDPKHRAIIRALHGPWDLSIQDTTEDLRLIIHMWIGLFYSRSTARFFHFDSDCTNPCSGDSDCLEIPTGMVPELKDNASVPYPDITKTSDTLISKALDLSKKDNSVLDQGSGILDLSLRNSNAQNFTSDPQVYKNKASVSGELKEASETSNTLKSSVEQQKCYRNSAQSTDSIGEVPDDRSTSESERTCTPLQKDGCLERTDVPSLKDGGTLNSVQEEMESASVQPENQQTASVIDCMNHRRNNEKTDMKDGIENSEATEMCLVQKQERDLSTCVIDKEVHYNKIAGDVVHTTERDETESKDVENLEVKEKPYQEGNTELSPETMHTSNDSTNEESCIVCNGNLLEDEKQFSSDKGKAISTCKAEHFTEDVDCCAVHKDEAMEGDYLVKEDGAGEKTLSISDVDIDRDLNDQALPMMCDGSNSEEKDCFTDCGHQAPLEEQPPQTDSEEDACHDLQLRKLCSNGSGLTDEKFPHIPPQKESIDNDPAVKENSENSICLAELHDQPLPMSEDPDSVKDCVIACNDQAPRDEEPPQADNKYACHVLQVLTCISKSTNDPPLTGQHVKSDNIPHTKSEMEPIHNEAAVEENPGIHVCLIDKAHHRNAALCENVETESQNQVTPNFNLRRNDHEDQDTKSVERQQTVESTTQKLFNYESHSPECEAVAGCEAEVVLTEETDLKGNKINREVEMIDGRVMIPFIGIDTSGDDTAQLHESDLEGKIDEVQGQRETTFISETAYPETGLSTKECNTSQMCSKKVQQSAGKTSPSIVDVSEVERPEVSACESDDRCPTPTIDEEPYQYATCESSSRNSSLSASETFMNMTQKCHNTLTDELSLGQKSPVKSAPNSDLELRTLRVLQSINKFFDKSGHTEKSSQIKTAGMKQTNKLQETSTGQDYSHPPRSFPSAEQALKPVTELPKQTNKALSQTNLSHEPLTFSHRPVMAVKPSKSEEVQAGCSSKDRDVSKNKPTQTLIFSDTTATSMLSQKTTESCKGKSANDDKQEFRELLSKISLSSASDSKADSDQMKFAHLDPLHQCEGRSISKFNTIPSSSLASSSLIQSSESPKTSKLVDGNQSFLTNSLVDTAGQTTKESFGMDHKDCSDPSTSAADYRVESKIDNSPLGPENSLICTVFNTGQERSESFLEQLSKRCLQDDLTQASVEQECLIFSEQMKQLLKRSRRDAIHQVDKFPCLSPVTVHFSILEEQDNSVVHSDALSLIGQKIHVDMSDRKGTTDEENILAPPKLSETSGNPVEHAGVSGVTAECARVYTARMNDVCAVKKVPCRTKHFIMDGGHPMMEPRNHFDFCDQMKREMDESFRSNLNSVVKKSCKTKYRFYILATSDDPFFEETKAQLTAEGHTAVQPSNFFLAEHHSSSLLIILRNEDIAEHICEVPHLLELKKSAGVQFAGIDEPDDVVNLTYQELFMRGGFIMFDRAALESLSICDMKKMAEILQELNRTGKWKWTLHYRDSRRLKENARLSSEAKEKKHFLNWCQEVGILEILPYHECDLTSRDQPDYLTCLVRLQVQNISARYPVFVTDSTAGSSFGPNGILTMTCSSILTCSPSKTFAV